MDGHPGERSEHRGLKRAIVVAAAGAVAVCSLAFFTRSGGEEAVSPTIPELSTTTQLDFPETTTTIESTTTTRPTTTTEVLEEKFETGEHVKSIEKWSDNAIAVAWNPKSDVIYYNSRDKDGVIGGYSANPDGSDKKCITCNIPELSAENNENTHIGIADVSPDGKYLLVSVQRADSWMINFDFWKSLGEPGKGADTDVWIMAVDGSWAKQLTDVVRDNKSGTLWSRFNEDGSGIVWGMIEKADYKDPATYDRWFGSETLHTATINYEAPGGPELVNIESHPKAYGSGGGLLEPACVFDGKIIYTSDRKTNKKLVSHLWMYDPTTKAEPVRLTPEGEYWNEFAIPITRSGGKKGLIYASNMETGNGGLDYRIMNLDGTNNQRLTFMNYSLESKQYAGFHIAGGLAQDPKNPNRFFAGVSRDLFANDVYAVMLTLSP